MRDYRGKTIVVTGAGGGDDPASVRRLFDRVAFTTAEQAARTIAARLRRDRARILVGPDARLIAALPRVLGPHHGSVVESAARLLRV